MASATRSLSLSKISLFKDVVLRAGLFLRSFTWLLTVEPSKENTLTPEVVMASRRRLIEKLEVIDNSEVNQIEVELYYSAGGMNYFNYKHEERGYYLSVSPYKFSVDGHFQSKRSLSFRYKVTHT